MCVIFVAHRAHERYPLIVAANRDEFHTRPTAPAHWWPDAPVLAGRDLSAGGTWLGLSRSGRFAAITNFHGGTQHGAPPLSRGSLVSEFLGGSADAMGYVRSIDPRLYNGFSLFTFDGDDLAFVSNRSGKPMRLDAGLYGLANASLDSDEPRVRELKSRIARMIDSDEVDASSLISTLASTELFIVDPVHGTRCSTAVIVDRAGGVTFIERSFDAEGTAKGEIREQFAIEPGR